MRIFLTIAAILMLTVPAMAQSKKPTLPAPVSASILPAAATTNSCDPSLVFKSLNPANFLAALQKCGVQDVADVIADANKQNPIDYGALACMIPLQPLVTAINSGGALMAFQAYRDARKSGVLSACIAWVNSTLAPIQ